MSSVTPLHHYGLHLAIMAIFCWCQAVRGDIYVSGFNSHGVYRFDETTGAAVGSGVFITAGLGGLSAPHGVMRLANGTFIVASANNDFILQYSSSGAYLGRFIENGQKGLPAGTLDYPVDLALGPNGDLFVSSQLNDRILRFNGTTGNFIGIFVAEGVVDGPSGLEWHANGSLYVAARFGGQVYRFDGNGAAVDGFSASGFGTVFGIAIHPTTGDVYMGNGSANAIRRLNPTTGAVLSSLTGGGISAPIGICFGPGGDVYAASFNNSKIARFDGATGVSEGDLVTTTAGSGAGLSGPNFFNFIPNFTAQESWRLQHFGTSANSGSAADGADPDGDSWNNLLEFTTGRLPGVVDSNALTVAAVGNVVQFTYPRNVNAVSDGWLFTVEWSESLQGGDWHTDSVSESVIGTVDNVETVRAELPGGAQGRRCVRLRVHR